MEKGLEVCLDDSAMCGSDPAGGPMGMHDCAGEWFRLESLRRMIVRTILKALIDWGQDGLNQQPTDQPTKQPKSRIIAQQTQ